MNDEYVNSYSTFKTSFNATIFQNETMVLSDIFQIAVDFVWATGEIEKQNSAFLKMKYFIEEILHQSVFTHVEVAQELVDLFTNNVVLLPLEPTNDMIAMALHAKLNSICEGYLEIVSVEIGSLGPGITLAYTYADDVYPLLPNIKEFMDSSHTYYDKPWWYRGTPETIDHHITEKEIKKNLVDLKSPPKYDNIFEDIDKLSSGKLVNNDEGNVIEIKAWRPEIVKD